MSPRPYRLGQRQVAIDQTRARMIAAARELLVSADPGRFSVDAVAQRADVSRATVYYQFRSRQGLIEALFDAAAAAGGMAGLPDAFGQPDPLARVLGQARQNDGLQVARKCPAQALGRSQRLLEQMLTAHLQDGRPFEHVLAGQEEICDGTECVDV